MDSVINQLVHCFLLVAAGLSASLFCVVGPHLVGLAIGYHLAGCAALHVVSYAAFAIDSAEQTVVCVRVRVFVRRSSTSGSSFPPWSQCKYIGTELPDLAFGTMYCCYRTCSSGAAPE